MKLFCATFILPIRPFRCIFRQTPISGQEAPELKFRFPIVIIDEDFRSENASGVGIRALAQALETAGTEVLAVTSYGDLSSFAQQQSRASAFVLSIDDEEFGAGSPSEVAEALKALRAFIAEIRNKNS